MAITPEILKELLKGDEKPEDSMGKDGILKQLNKALMETTMGAEFTSQFGWARASFKRMVLNQPLSPWLHYRRRSPQPTQAVSGG